MTPRSKSSGHLRSDACAGGRAATRPPPLPGTSRPHLPSPPEGQQQGLSRTGDCPPPTRPPPLPGTSRPHLPSPAECQQQDLSRAGDCPLQSVLRTRVAQHRPKLGERDELAPHARRRMAGGHGEVPLPPDPQGLLRVEL